MHSSNTQLIYSAIIHLFVPDVPMLAYPTFVPIITKLAFLVAQKVGRLVDRLLFQGSEANNNVSLLSMAFACHKGP